MQCVDMMIQFLLDIIFGGVLKSGGELFLLEFRVHLLQLLLLLVLLTEFGGQ
jgi:hypothetical protein